MKKINYEALAQKVLVVCVANFRETKELFDWSCYIDAVSGINHDLEYQRVATHGTKLNPKFAALLFPDLDIEKYRL